MSLFSRLAELFGPRHAAQGVGSQRYRAKFKPHVAFDTDIPTDAVEDEEGMDFVVWGGANLARIVSEYLTAAGYEMSEPLSAEHAGWEFEARKPQEHFWLRVCEFDQSRRYLVTEDMFARWPREAYVRFLTLIDEALHSDSRFYNLSWFDQSGSPDADNPGWPHPTRADPAAAAP